MSTLTKITFFVFYCFFFLLKGIDQQNTEKKYKIYINYLTYKLLKK